MATQRLNDWDRGQIKREFAEVLARVQFNKKFPIDKEELWDFGMSLLEPKTAECYEYLRTVSNHLTNSSTWNSTLVVYAKTSTYEITLCGSSELPQNSSIVPKEHPMYQQLLEWSEYYSAVTDDMFEAKKYVHGLVNCCSSVGQIKRVLEDDLLRYLPNSMLESLAGAERRSRMPKGFVHNPEKLEHLGKMLALASISPSTRSGNEISLHKKPATLHKKPAIGV